MKKNADQIENSGKSFITLDMDQERALRWDFGNILKFEDRARNILKRQEVLQPGVSINAGMVLTRFIRNADILQAAVAAATGLSGLETKEGKPSQAAEAIQAYIERGGTLEELQKQVYHAYLVVNDPSSISEWELNLANDAELERIQKAKTANMLEMARMDLAEQEKRMAEMKKPSGAEPAR